MSKPWNSLDALKVDCRFFRGDVPCKPHKQHGIHCIDEQGHACTYYEQLTSKILIIKLGAIGDVIRTTPLLHKLKATHPQAQIWWLTLTPDVVPRSVDVILPFTPQSLATLSATKFDILYNLDKDKEACALASSLQSTIKKGFTLWNGKAAPSDNDAVAKYMTGVFDDLNKENTKSYLEEIFEICGFTFAGEEYFLDPQADKGYSWKLPKKKRVVGLNTGCGGRWVSRLWAEKNWIALAKKLKNAGYVPLLLGGEQEHEKNKRIARTSGALYFGHFSLQKFINEVDQCDLVVTAVTMAMHITIGLHKKIVLFNNIFNRDEFELYGRGEILEPEFDCPCYFSPVCPNDCMQYIYVDRVFKSVKRLLST
ncbi:MAG TPA: glycosyltransferase family 9 protein [Bacteroidetes bacterium]|nr:glycosyltransferase family 9 protein [Bacteroidota bacterium]